jgi:hypothetical protein
VAPEQRRHLPAGDRLFEDRRPLVLAGRRLLDAHRGAGVGALARRHVLDVNEAAIEDQLDGKLVGARLTGAHHRRGVRDRGSERVLEHVVGEERERLALVAIPGGGAARSGEAVEGDGLADPVALAIGRTGDAARPGVAERRVRRENTGRSVPVALRRHRPIAAPKLDIDPLEVAQQCLADPHLLDVDRPVAEREQRPPVDVATDRLAVGQRRVGRRLLEPAAQERQLAPGVGAVTLSGDGVGRLILAVVFGQLGHRRRQEVVDQQRAADRHQRRRTSAERHA